MARWKKARRANWRQKYLGDLRHVRACCRAGRLPPHHLFYIEGVLRDPDNLPKPVEVAERIGLTYELQQQNHLYRIPPVDKTKAELNALRRAKDAARQERLRRHGGAMARQVYLASVKSDKPWIAAGMSRRTWFRRQAKNSSKTVSATLVAPGSSRSTH